MSSSRLEAFSDAILAIVVTVMVLELKIPNGPDLNDIYRLIPKLLAYILSYVYIILYWINHHHILQSIKRVNVKIIWANFIWILLISFLPFTTAWVSEFYRYQMPTMLYGIVLLLTGLAYVYLQKQISIQSENSNALGRTLGTDKKGIFSLFLYLTGILLSFFYPIFAMLCYLITALIWLKQDHQLSNVIVEMEREEDEKRKNENEL